MSAPRVVVIGGGMAGILSAVKLEELGLRDFCVYEKAEGLGGTWRFNTYPGIACDVPSHLYSYSFAPNPEWSHVFSPGAEILRYLEDVAHANGVDRRVRCATEVLRLDFDGRRWRIETTDGTDEADVVIAATGVLHQPSYPDIDGIDSFAGPIFHSSCWDRSVPWEGVRLGVVGTGSSAVQIVSSIVESVGELRLFQRTAQWVLPVDNPPIEDSDKQTFRENPSAMSELRASIGRMFEDNFANAVVDADSPQVELLENLCRANLEDHVKDPDLREKLRPDYRAACKRLIISPNFYDAVQRPNAHVVTEPIERIEPSGIRTKDGVLHELDAVVLATGFRVDRFMRPMKISGRDGVDLDEIWQKRPNAYLSISIPGFPNLFMLNGPNGPVGNFSLIDVAELQFGYISKLLELVAEDPALQVSATKDATERFESSRSEAAKKTVWMTGCRSWYLDDRGIPAVWPWSFDRFRQEMAGPELSHFEIVAG